MIDSVTMPTTTTGDGPGSSFATSTRRGLGVGPRSERERRRFELYCRWTLHVLLLMAVFFIATSSVVAGPVTAAEHGWSHQTGLVLAGVAVVLGVVWAGLGAMVTELVLTERPVPRPVLLAFAVAAVVALVAHVSLIPGSLILETGMGPLFGLGPTVIAVTATIAALTNRWKSASLGAVAGIALMVVVMFARPGLPDAAPFVAAWVTFWFCVFLIPTGLLTRWMIDVVRRLWQAQQVVADLAVAEERLRFSRDLHDVFGRTLSAVAMKSELAAELARRGDDRAVEQMQEVRALAQTSLSDIRGLVRGYRRIELADELAGARSVLRAAGLRVRTVGVDDLDRIAERVGDTAAEALAWVVREGVTNVLRHAQTGEVRVTLVDDADRVQLQVANDLPRRKQAAHNGDGSGLVGLRERVEAVGGTLDFGPVDDAFVLSACVPTTTKEGPA
ncbi:MAG: histidine kinase [Mobilicoccus sp.]|nr:histidine kinase [Mobilicoccus sp.]